MIDPASVEVHLPATPDNSMLEEFDSASEPEDDAEHEDLKMEDQPRPARDPEMDDMRMRQNMLQTLSNSKNIPLLTKDSFESWRRK